MKFIDTHAHLYAKHFSEDTDAMIMRAKNVLEAVYLPNIDYDSVESMLHIWGKYPDFLFPMMGLHPCSVEKDFEKTLAKMLQHLEDSTNGKQDSPKYTGIGETGIDLYWDKTHFAEQKEALLIQIEWAKRFHLPIILHCREALDIVIEIIEKNHNEHLSGIFHCFDGNFFQAKKISEIPNFKMGIGGNITYKKSTLPEVLENIDLQHIVLETDSPYLPPTPHRGKRNESSYLTLVAQKLAEIKGVGLREIARITNENAKEIFCSQTYSR